MINYGNYSNIASISLPGIVIMDSVQGAVVNQVTLTIQKTSGGAVKLDWGDGNIVTLSAGTQVNNYTSTYVAGNQTYHISIYDDLDKVTSFYVYNENTLEISINQARKFRNLITFDISLLKAITGSLNTIRSGLQNFRIYGATAVTGEFSNLPHSIKILDLEGMGASITGSNIVLWEGLEEVRFSSGVGIAHVLSMDITNLPSTLRIFNSQAIMEIVGSINNLPVVMTEFYLENTTGLVNPVTGNLDNMPAGMTKLFIVCYPDHEAQTLFTGTTAGLPRNLTFLILASCVQLTGDVADLPPNINETLWISDNLASRGIYGNIADLPIGVYQLSLVGHDLTGNMRELPFTNYRGGVFTDNGGGITVGEGTCPAWELIMSTINFTIQEGWTTAEVDAFLIGWAATASNNPCTLNLAGGVTPNQARSAASDAAVATLQGLGKTILTT